MSIEVINNSILGYGTIESTLSEMIYTSGRPTNKRKFYSTPIPNYLLYQLNISAVNATTYANDETFVIPLSNPPKYLSAFNGNMYGYEILTDGTVRNISCYMSYSEQSDGKYAYIEIDEVKYSDGTYYTFDANRSYRCKMIGLYQL